MKRKTIALILGLLAVCVSIGVVGYLVVSDADPGDRSELVTKKPEYHGRQIDAIVSELGEPDRAATLQMNQGLDEFRAELRNTYPHDGPASASVVIKELWWRQGDYTLTIWFHQVNGEWVALDTCYWHDSIVF